MNMPNQLSKMSLAVALAIVAIGAQAQDANSNAQANQEAADKNGLNLDTVVITGSPIGKSKMKASVAISTLEADQIMQASPTNAAEILRSIPGVRAESSGGGGERELDCTWRAYFSRWRTLRTVPGRWIAIDLVW